MRVDRLSNPLKLVNAGSFLYIFHFYRRESEDPNSLCNYFGFLKQIANISHPSTGRGLRKDGIGLDQEKRTVSRVEIDAYQLKS